MFVEGKAVELLLGGPSGLPIVRTAMYEMMSHRLENVQYGEKAYMNMYEELRQNEQEWEEVRSGSCMCMIFYSTIYYTYLFLPGQFFQHPMNELHCLDICHILNILNGILLDRCELETVGNINEMSSKFFFIAQQYRTEQFRNQSPDNEKWHDVEEALLRNKYSLNMMLCNYTAMIPIFRRDCELEIERNLPGVVGSSTSRNGSWKKMVGFWGMLSKNPKDGSDISDAMLQYMLAGLKKAAGGKGDISFEKAKYWRKLERECEGAETVNDLSDEVIEEVIRTTNEIAPLKEINAENNRDVHLRSCGNYNKTESACGEFNRCNRCKSIVYCGRGKIVIAISP